MNHYQLEVQGMTCQKCVKAITQALEAADPEVELEIELENRLLELNTHLSLETVREQIRAAGYQVV